MTLPPVMGEKAPMWQPIETAPKMRTVLLFAITDTSIGNWKMATGCWCTGYENDAKHSAWEWDGRHLRKHETQPTHWMPLPEPPQG